MLKHQVPDVKSKSVSKHSVPILHNSFTRTRGSRSSPYIHSNELLRQTSILGHNAPMTASDYMHSRSTENVLGEWIFSHSFPRLWCIPPLPVPSLKPHSSRHSPTPPPLSSIFLFTLPLVTYEGPLAAVFSLRSSDFPLFTVPTPFGLRSPFTPPPSSLPPIPSYLGGSLPLAGYLVVWCEVVSSAIQSVWPCKATRK